VSEETNAVMDGSWTGGGNAIFGGDTLDRVGVSVWSTRLKVLLLMLLVLLSLWMTGTTTTAGANLTHVTASPIW
jgi:hypothetical protein